MKTKIIKYQVVNPNGNITAIINGKYPTLLKQQINQSIFAQNKMVEQIGYIYQNGNQYYFEMMSNEFSGNGCLAAGSYLLNYKTGQTNFRSSGFKKPVLVISKNGFSKLFLPKLPTPIFRQLGKKIACCRLFNTKFYLVKSRYKDNIVKAALASSCNENAIGVMFYQRNNGIKLLPYFYTKSVGKFILESSCGSGSITLGLYLLKNRNLKKIEVIQPSGRTLTITNSPITFSGTVKKLSNYNVKINL